MKHHSAFTLIELLIVVLIIAILAAIAVPNFLEFQTRAKVSRVKADLRSLATAVEAYMVDNDSYPLDGDDYLPPFSGSFDVFKNMTGLTTPISYISSLPPDPFHLFPVVFPGSTSLFPNTEPPFTYIYNTFGKADAVYPSPGPINKGHPDNYGLSSLGPSQTFDSAVPVMFGGFNDVYPGPFYYDPTNGTVSPGDIHYLGGTRQQYQ